MERIGGVYFRDVGGSAGVCAGVGLDGLDGWERLDGWELRRLEDEKNRR